MNNFSSGSATFPAFSLASAQGHRGNMAVEFSRQLPILAQTRFCPEISMLEARIHSV